MVIITHFFFCSLFHKSVEWFPFVIVYNVKNELVECISYDLIIYYYTSIFSYLLHKYNFFLSNLIIIAWYITNSLYKNVWIFLPFVFLYFINCFWECYKYYKVPQYITYIYNNIWTATSSIYSHNFIYWLDYCNVWQAL
jgi:hypothetical protein